VLKLSIGNSESQQRQEEGECRALDKYLRRDSPGNSLDRPKELARVGDQAVLPPETVGVSGETKAGTPKRRRDRTTRDDATIVARAQA